ncbi:hypothetical protein AAMO2058_001224000 [Amorphochlora amoebiformis]
MKIFPPLLLFLGAIWGGYSAEVDTFVGSTQGSADGVGTNALLSFPSGFAQVSPTEILFSDTVIHSIRKLNPYTKEVTTVLGSSTAGFVDGKATTARFYTPWDLAYSDFTQILYIVDTNNHALRAYNMNTGLVSTVAGSGAPGYTDGIGTYWTTFTRPNGIALNTDQSILYLTDDISVRRVALSTGEVTRVTGAPGSGIFGKLSGVAAMGDILYVSDVGTCEIRVVHGIHKKQQVVAGSSSVCNESTTGSGTNAHFYLPTALNFAWNSTGLLYVATRTAISTVDVSNAQVTRIAGSQSVAGYTDGEATDAKFLNPWAIFVSMSGRIFVGESSYRIRSYESDDFTQAPTVGGPSSSFFPENPTLSPVPVLGPSIIPTVDPISIHPTSRSPSTLNPFSSSPTSYHPATAHPVSSHPITYSPATSSPITSSPTTSKPSTLHPSSHPVTGSPLTSSPQTAFPASFHPATANPLSSHPVTDSPATSSPITSSPTTSKPSTLHPSSHPVTGAPLTSSPHTAFPASFHPATAHPLSSHPVTDSPATSNPITSSPTTSKPSTLQPSTHPVTDSPATPSPITSSPTTCQPVSLHPSSHPVTSSPFSSSPLTVSPASAHPNSLHPASSHPAANLPGTSNPPTSSPVNSHPTTIQPESSHPGSNSPVTLSPLTSSPTSYHPASSHPASTHPATTSPLTIHPLTTFPVSSHPQTQQPSSNPVTSSPLTPNPLTSSPTSSHPAMSHPGSSHPSSNFPLTLSPLTASPASSHPAIQHPSSSHPTTTPVTLAPTTQSPSSSHPGSTHPLTAGLSGAPTTGLSAGHTGYPTPGASAPILSLSAPPEVGTCGILRIEASVQSVGSVNVTWFLNGHPLTSSQAALVLSYSELQTHATASGIGNMVDGTLLSFTARAVDQATGMSSSIQQALVTHRGVMRPSLILSGPSTSASVHPSEALRLSVIVQHASCVSVTASDLSLISLRYRWEITSGGSSLGLALENSPEIIVPPGSLLPSQTHQVVVTLSGISSLYPGVSSVQTSLTLSASDVPVIAVLSTGATARVPSGTGVSLDGSKSNDPANLSGGTRSFSWNCITPSPSPTSCNSYLTPSSTGESAFLSPDSLTPGSILNISLTFTVFANLGASIGTIIRSSTTSTTIFGVARAPLVFLTHQTSKTVTVPGFLPGGSTLRLSCVVTPYPSTVLSASQLTYSWNESSGLLDGIAASKRLSDLGAPGLVLAAGSLTPGLSYAFSLSVTDPSTGGGAGQATVYIKALASPSVTSVVFSPLTGVVMETTFEFVAHATVSDLNQMPLYYQFLVRKVEGREVAVGNTRKENTKKAILDQSGTLEVGVEVCDSFGSMAKLWGSGTIDLQATSAFEDPCTALNKTNLYLIGLLREIGYPASSKETCIGDSVFFHLDLLSSLQARSAIFEATNYILSFLGSFPSNIATPCLACNSYSTYSSYESSLFSQLISLLQPFSNSTAYTSQTAETLYALAASPLTTKSTAGSQSALVSNLLALSPELSPTSTIGFRSSSNIADALSSLALAQDPKADDLTRSLLLGVSRDMIPGEVPAVLITSAFEAHVQALEAVSKTSTTSSGVNVTVPSGLATTGSDTRLMIVSWKPGLPAGTPKVSNQAGESLASDVEDVTLTDSNGNNIVLPEKETIRIAIPLKEGETTDADMRCVYIQSSDSTWSEDGCYLDVQGSSVACVCTHLTEFAVMRRAKKNQWLPDSLRWSYICGSCMAWVLAICAAVQAVRMGKVKAHRGWIAIAHYLLTFQGLFRGLSSLMYSGIIEKFSLARSHAAVVVTVTALPYTFSFWTASLIAFQWMATAFNPRLRTNNFHANRYKYYISNALIVVIMWVFILAMWVFNVEEISLVGPLLMAFVCLLLVVLYLVGGFTISRQLKKSFTIMTVSRSSEKVQKQMRHAEEVGTKAMVYAGCFGAISIIWILSAIFRDDFQVLQILVPAFLFLDTMGGSLVLIMYARSVRQTIRKSSLSLDTHPSNDSKMSSGRVARRSVGLRSRKPRSRKDLYKCLPKHVAKFQQNSVVELSDSSFSKNIIARSRVAAGNTIVSPIQRRSESPIQRRSETSPRAVAMRDSPLRPISPNSNNIPTPRLTITFGNVVRPSDSPISIKSSGNPTLFSRDGIPLSLDQGEENFRLASPTTSEKFKDCRIVDI